MKNSSMEYALKKHYQQRQLSAETLACMVAMADGAEQARQQRCCANFWRQRWSVQRRVSLAALVTLLLIPLMWLTDEPLLTRVAQEVVLNHNKQLASDYRVDRYEVLVAMMDKLDFQPRPPARLTQAGSRLSGARYCSIQGGIAAQLKLTARGGESVTLYQTRLTPALAALGEQLSRLAGVEVESWHEGDIFFALARSTSSAAGQ